MIAKFNQVESLKCYNRGIRKEIIFLPVTVLEKFGLPI